MFCLKYECEQAMEVVNTFALDDVFCSGLSISYDNLGNIFPTIVDINECETDKCDQHCINKLSSYYCTYRGILDNYTCNGLCT